MKRALLILAVCAGFFTSSKAQVTSITVEEFYTDNGSVAGYPAGHTTYRIYANTTSATDRVTTVSGTAFSPLALDVSGSGVWNFNGGGVTGDALPCIIFNSQPLAQYDSYITIGASCNNDGAANPIYTAEDVAQPWQTPTFGAAPYGDGSVIVNSTIGGTWFVLPDNPNSEAGADLKILLAQITTNGNICGTFNLQEFPNYAGAGSQSINSTFEFSSTTGCTPGCNDPAADNYDESANYNDGSCLYPCAIELEAVVTSPISCFGESAEVTLTASGSQAFYDFEENGLSPSGQIELTLTPGEYTYVVNDTRFDNPDVNPSGEPCSATVTITIADVQPVFIGSSVAQDVSCPGDSNGSVSTDVTNYGGGTGALTFNLWTVGGSSIPLTTPDYSGLAVDSYYFEVVDENGCSANGSTFTIESPPSISITTGIVQADCSNSINIPVTLAWSGGTGDVDFSLNANGPFDIEGTNASVTVIAESIGTFTIYARDEEGCTFETDFQVVGAPVINISEEITPISCFGETDGGLSVTATGGTGAFTYSFDGGATFSSVSEINNQGATVIEVTVQDANDCEASASFTIEEPAELSAVGNPSTVSCNGDSDGEIEVVVSGGTFPYLYQLNNTPEGDDVSPFFTGLTPGSYVVNVVDINGCSFVATIPTIVGEPAILTASATASDVSCFGETDGSIIVTPAGGTGPYQYSVDGGPSISDNIVLSLSANSYLITVIDNNNCETSISATVAGPSEALIIDGLSPVGGGSSAYNVTGGTAPYSFMWTGPNGFTSMEEALEGMTAVNQSGEYALTVTDANGCTASQTIIIIGLTEVNASYQIQMYPNPNNGQFTLNMQGLTGEAVSYAVLDNSGRIVASKDLGSVGTARTESVDMTYAAAGIYQLRINVNGHTQSSRFVKQ
jgi:hypothetical protein